MPSNITTSITPDSPVSLAANYQLTAADRRRIDDQIVGMQRHLAQGLLRGQTRSFFKLAADSVSLAKGDLFCVAAVEVDETDANTAVRTVTRADATALAAAGVVLGVAATPASPGATFQGITDGIVGRAITGLASSAAGAVRATSARCERVASFGGSDFAVGFVDAVGNLTLSQTAAGAAVGGGASLATVAPPAVGTSNVLGTSVKAAKEDHAHDHGAQTDPTHHGTAIATGSGGARHGFFHSDDKRFTNRHQAVTVVMPAGTNNPATDVANFTAALAELNAKGATEFVFGPGIYDFNTAAGADFGSRVGLKIRGCALGDGLGTTGTVIKSSANRSLESCVLNITGDRNTIEGIAFWLGKATTGIFRNSTGGDQTGNYTHNCTFKGDIDGSGVPITRGTSTDTVAIGFGSKTFAVPGLVAAEWPVGSHVLARVAGGSYGSIKQMVGIVTASSAGSVTIDVYDVAGSGSGSSWTLHYYAYGERIEAGAVHRHHSQASGCGVLEGGSNGLEIEPGTCTSAVTGPFCYIPSSSTNVNICAVPEANGQTGYGAQLYISNVFGGSLRITSGDSSTFGGWGRLNTVQGFSIVNCRVHDARAGARTDCFTLQACYAISVNGNTYSNDGAGGSCALINADSNDNRFCTRFSNYVVAIGGTAEVIKGEITEGGPGRLQNDIGQTSDGNFWAWYGKFLLDVTAGVGYFGGGGYEPVAGLGAIGDWRGSGHSMAWGGSTGWGIFGGPTSLAQHPALIEGQSVYLFSRQNVPTAGFAVMLRDATSPVNGMRPLIQFDPNGLFYARKGSSTVDGQWWPNENEKTLTPGASVTIDATASDQFALTLGQDTTLALPDPGFNREIVVRFIQGASPWAVTLPAGVKTPSGAGIVLAAAAGSVTPYKFRRYGTNLWLCWPLAATAFS